jgi:uncharacterized protein
VTVPASLTGSADEAPGEPRPSGWSVPALGLWVVVALVTFFGGTLVEDVGMPAPHLLTGLVVGLVLALTGLARRAGVVLPRLVYLAAQAVAGVLLGTYFSLPALGRVGWALVPLVAVTVATLLLSVGAGLLLARRTGLDEPTAALGLIAGGSSGIVAAADDLHADARLVAVLQYVRLILVVLSAPLLVRFVLAPHGTYAAVGAKEIEATASLHGYVLTIGLAVLGALAGTKLKIPAGALIVPLVLTASGGGLGLWNDLQPPETVREPAFIVIGLAVGLGFDVIVLRRALRAAPAALAAIVVIIVACGALAAVVAATTDVSLLDAYLATTPGGINAVLVTAFAAGASTSLVFGLQGLRLFVMVLVAPVLVRYLLRRSRRRDVGTHSAK